MDPTSLFVGLFLGSIGTGYFIYGKKQNQLMPMLSGFGLCVLPYFISSYLLLAFVSLALMAGPFLIRS